MSDVRDPDRDQTAPVHNNNASCHDLVIADMEERKEFGLRKYNTHLQAFNGRSFTQDAYEEVLDLAVYLRGKLEEEKTSKHPELTTGDVVVIKGLQYEVWDTSMGFALMPVREDEGL